MPLPFGKYQLLRKLATGGMGEIFLASAGEGQPPIVIKRILPHLTEDPQLLRMFLAEARIVAQLNHPNIVRLLDMGEIDGAWYLAMEYVDGPDLAWLLRTARNTRQRLPPAITVRVAADTAGALHAAHIACDLSGVPLGVVHRDVSPQNILVGLDGRARLIDFGVARDLSRRGRTESGTIRGKLAYMSPEQASSGKVDARSDIFALGVVLWEGLTGLRLFGSASDALTLHRLLECRVAPPSSLAEGVPEGLDSICLRALDRSPDKRFADAEGLRRELVSAAERAGLGTQDDVAQWVRALTTRSDETVSVAAEGPLVPGGLSRGSGQLLSSGPREPPGGLEAPPSAGDAEVWRDEPSDPGLGRGPLLSRVPAPGNILVGREAELQRLANFFVCGERLVTVHGPAGIGKTRLALAAAQSASKGEPPAAAVFCSLRSARDAVGICLEVCRALGAGPLTARSREDAAEQAGAALRACGDVLVVLDPFEELLRHAPETVARWLQLAPRAQFLVTSRVPLALEKELAMALEPLPLDDAAQLLLELQPALTRARANELVARCGGLPLALELVGRVGELSAFTFDGSLRRAPGPSVVTSWSLKALSADERTAARRSAVFTGGSTRHAAETVCGGAATVEALERARLLTAVTPPGAGADERLELHDGVQLALYDEARLAGVDGEARERHAAWCLAHAEALGGLLGSAEAEAAIERLARERDNLLAVFRWALERARGGATGHDGLVAAVLALEPLLHREGPVQLHLGMLDTALEVVEPDGEAPQVGASRLARALLARGTALRAAERLAEAATDLRQALRWAQDAKDAETAARVRLELARSQLMRGRAAEARAALEQVRSMTGAGEGTRAEAAVALAALLLAHADPAGARSQLEEARSRARGAGTEVRAQVQLGWHELQRAQGELEGAASSAEEAARLFRAARNRHGEGLALAALGRLHRDHSLPAEGAQALRGAATCLRAAGQAHLAAQVLGELVGLEHEHGQLEAAERHARRLLALAKELADPPLQGLGLARLCAVFAAGGQAQRARATYEAASSRLLSLRPDGAPLLSTLEAYLTACEDGAEGAQAAQAKLEEGEQHVAAHSGAVVRVHRDLLRLLRKKLDPTSSQAGARR